MTQPWGRPFTIPAGMNWADAIQRMVNERMPEQIEFRVKTPTELKTSVKLVFGTDPAADPWRDMEEMAMVAGYQLVRKDWVVSLEPLPPIDAGSWKFESDEDTQ